MKYITAILVLFIFAGCADPVKKLRNEAISSYREFWEKPEQLHALKITHDIPSPYIFKDLEVSSYSINKEENYGLYEWSFKFGQNYKDMIEIRKVCFYDLDSIVMYDIKTERIHWNDNKIDSREYSFRGIDDNKWKYVEKPNKSLDLR